MSVHVHPAGTPDPDGRESFLVDGCDRCAEFVENYGLSFEPERYFAFWQKMIAVEYDWSGGYRSKLDKELGRRLYALSLGLQRVFDIDPRALSPLAAPAGAADPGEALRGLADEDALLQGVVNSALIALYTYKRDHLQAAPAKFRVSPAADEAMRAEVQRAHQGAFTTMGDPVAETTKLYGVPVEVDESLSGSEVVCG